MTFQEAQDRFAAIADAIPSASSSPAGLLEIQGRLQALLDALPNRPEFDPIADAITALSPRLFGAITQKTLDDLRRRTANLQAATQLLNRTAAEAESDARILHLERPQLLAAGLNNCVTTVRELREAAKNGDTATAGAKAEALLALLAELRSTLKPDPAN